MDPMFGFCSSEENAFGQPQRAYILSRADRMPQSEDPPRITHVLRPHHIALLSVFVLILRQPVSPKFNLYVWRVLAREIAEVYHPKTFTELVDLLSAGPSDMPDEGFLFARGMRNVPKHLSTHDGMSQFFADVIAFVPEREYEGQPQVSNENQSIERRSYFGLFIRRCYLSYFKLSWRGAMKTLNDYKAWVAGEDAGYNLQSMDREGGLLLVPTASDELQYAQIDPFERYQKAVKVGDTQSAIENLRRFFDQRFSETEESGLTQHALLNLAQLHYSLGEYSAARQAADEALKISRTSNDSLMVQHCTNLLRRITPLEANVAASTKPFEVKRGMPPREILWEVKRLMDAGEPLRVGFRKIYESIGCYSSSVNTALTLGSPFHNDLKFRWARHAVQATLWSLAGVESLAQTHEGIVITFTEPGEDESRLNALLSRAKRFVRQGSCGAALLVLLDPGTWRGLNLRQYGAWAKEVWRALAVTASRRTQSALIREFLVSRRPPEPISSQTITGPAYFPTHPPAVVALRNSKMLRESRSFSEALTNVLDALWSTEFRGLWGLHRTSKVIMADISIEFGMATKGRRLIEEVLPQVLNGDDLEMRAYTCHTLGRCILATSSSDIESDAIPSPEKQLATLRESLPFFHVAERDYGTVEMHEERLETIYTLCVVYHNISLLDPAQEREMLKKRDRMADLHMEVDSQRKLAGEMQVDDELKEVLDLVVEVAGVITR